MKPYILSEFGKETPGIESEFVAYFDASQKPKKADRKQDIEDETRKIFEDAFVQGEKAGYDMGMKKVEPLIKRLNNHIAELSSFRDELVKKSEQFAIELALTFSEAIVLKECEEKREVIMNMVRKAIDLCEDKSQIVIKIRSEDAKHIPQQEIGSLKVFHDDTLKDPGFVIETKFGDIDGRIAIQIEELKKEFLNGCF